MKNRIPNPSRIPLATLALLALVWCGNSSRAAETNAEEPTQTAATEQPANPALVDVFQKWLKPTEGLEFQINYIGEVLGDVSGGYRQGAIYEGLLKAGVQLDLEKLTGWKGGALFVNMLYPHGDSLTQKYTHDLNVVSNIDAYDTVRLNEAWFEQKLFGDHFAVRIGEQALDTEFFVCDSGAVFINSCFGSPPFFSLNFAAPTYPLSAPGVRVQWTPSESFLWRTGIYSGDVGDQGRNNTHGGRVAFSSESGALVLSELVYKTNAGKDATGLPGTFKLGGFCDTGKLDDVRNNGDTHWDDYGAYFIFDQAIYREQHAAAAPTGKGEKSGKDVSKETASANGKDEKADNDQGLNFFTRIGGALPNDRNLVNGYLEGGLTYKGLIPGRDKDVCAVACSYTHISKDVRDDSGGAISSHHETVLEATYQVAVTDWLSVQPDFQYVINPGGTDDTQNAVVIGVRATLTF